MNKDSSGRIVIHSQLWPKVNWIACLAAGTVDSLLGKLSAIFNNIGRLRLTLKSTLNLFARNRKARLLSPPRQCFMLRFLRSFSQALDKMQLLSFLSQWLYFGEGHYFLRWRFFTRNRSSDLGRLLASQVFISLKDRKGFLLGLTLT